MDVRDFDGDAKLQTVLELKERLSSVRRRENGSSYGAFILSHKKDGPSLWILVNDRVAYIHYYPHPDYLVHAGYHATGKTPAECTEPVTFRTLDEDEDEGEEWPVIDCDKIIALDDALVAATEFFDDVRPPGSIEWVEL